MSEPRPRKPKLPRTLRLHAYSHGWGLWWRSIYPTEQLLISDNWDDDLRIAALRRLRDHLPAIIKYLEARREWERREGR